MGKAGNDVETLLADGNTQGVVAVETLETGTLFLVAAEDNRYEAVAYLATTDTRLLPTLQVSETDVVSSLATVAVASPM